MIYARGAEYNRSLSPYFTTHPLSACKFEPNTIYWHDQHDIALRRLRLRDSLDEQHLQHIRADPTAKILLFYGDEYFNINDVKWYAQDIKDAQINPSQVYLVTIDGNWERWAREKFTEQGLPDINICHYNTLLKKTNVSAEQPQTRTHRFSSFSRNYNKWRLRLFGELAKRDLLRHFAYSFSNIQPYVTPPEYVPLEQLREQLIANDQWNTNTEQWFMGIPYHLPKSDIIHKWSSETEDTIKASGMHILVESHYDAFNNFPHLAPNIAPQDFSPAFPTEKTYKVLFSRRPFMVYTTPYFMQELKTLGFQTFDSVLDESYDGIEDNMVRWQKIVDEIQRLASMSDQEFQSVLDRCQHIVDHNYNRITELHQQIQFPEKFSWIQDHMYF